MPVPDPVDKLLGELMASGTVPPALEASSTQGRISLAALELFAERSYEAATTRAIAERAGVTERTLFKHVGSKEQLFARTVYPALLRLLQPLTVEAVKRVLGEGRGDFASSLRALVAERVGFASRHPGLVRMVARELLLRPAFRAAFGAFFLAQFYPYIERFLAEARDSGQLRELPTSLVLRTIASQIMAYVALRAVSGPEGDWDEEADARAIVDVIMHGLAARPPA